MVNNENDLQELRKNINEMKQGDFNQMALITYYSLGSYFKSLVAFGRKNPITKDNLQIIKEMYQIIIKERKLLNFILKNIDEIDVSEALDAIYMLDELNDETVAYYYDVIEDIEAACYIKEEHRGIRKQNNTPTLLESDSYAMKIMALAENDNSLRDFLKFDDNFWQVASSKTLIKDEELENSETKYYAKAILNEFDLVADFRIIVPKVINLETALIAIKVYKEAYNIYKYMGKVYEPFSEENALKAQEEFKENYLLSKAKKL